MLYNLFRLISWSVLWSGITITSTENSKAKVQILVEVLCTDWGLSKKAWIHFSLSFHKMSHHWHVMILGRKDNRKLSILFFHDYYTHPGSYCTNLFHLESASTWTSKNIWNKDEKTSSNNSDKCLWIQKCQFLIYYRKKWNHNSLQWLVLFLKLKKHHKW